MNTNTPNSKHPPLKNPPVHTGVAINHAEEHENRIHSDDIAAKLGFEGALVPGVTVFGLTSIAITKQFGAAWLEGSCVHTRFLKPAYHNDILNVYATNENHANEAKCFNELGTLLCTLNTNPLKVAAEFSQYPFDTATTPIPATRIDRPVIQWDLIKENSPFPPRSWRPSSEENAKLAAEVQDSHPCFTEARENLVHPHLLLSHANQTLVDEFEMPAWIHVGSELRLHQALQLNRTYRVFATPTRKWRHKGHEFLTLYIAYLYKDKVQTEIFHTAIFRIAGT